MPESWDAEAILTPSASLCQSKDEVMGPDAMIFIF